MRSLVLIAVWCVAGPLAVFAQTKLEAPIPLRMGCVAYAKTATADAYKLVRDFVAKELGREIVLTVYPNYLEIVHDVVNDKLDVAILSPLVYLNAVQARPLNPLGYGVSRGSGNFTYHGIVLVRKDDPSKTLSDLAGRKMAFVDIMSASGYLVPKEALVSDAKEAAQVQEKLRTLWTSEFVIPGDVFVATDQLPAAERKRVRSALLAYCTAQEKGASPANGMYEGFAPGDPNLYNDMRRFLARVTAR
jgi:ABC-type phosphate/phosphonate transport system substrate-binding protein